MIRIFASLLLGTLLWAGGCTSPQKGTTTTPPLHLLTAEARVEHQAVERTFIAYLDNNFSATIQPRVNGFLLAKHYNDGMPVRRGELLFTLEGRELRTSQLAAVAALESARAQLIEARNNYERALPLARIEAISRAQLDQYTAQYRAAEARVQSAEQSLRSAELQVGYTRITSPIDGIVAATEAHAGDYVGPGTRFEVLTTISNLDTLSVELQLPTADYLVLGGNRPDSYRNEGFLSDIRLYLSDGSLYPHAGRYDYTRKDVSQAEGTLSLVVEFPNPEGRLKAGEFARVKARVGEPQRCVVVPAEAVSQAQGISSVWVVAKDSTVAFRRVEVGRLLPSGLSILAGLDSGERVVCEGLQKIHQGEKIAF